MAANSRALGFPFYGAASQSQSYASVLPFVTPQQFGAYGDGQHDDTDALGKWALALAQGYPGLMETGVYLTKSPFLFTVPVRIEGNGARIKLTAAADYVMRLDFTGTGLACGARIGGIVLDGSGLALDGLDLRGVVESDFVNVRATNITRAAVHLDWVQTCVFSSPSVSWNAEPLWNGTGCRIDITSANGSGVVTGVELAYRFAVSGANAFAGATYTYGSQTFKVLFTIAGSNVLYCSGTGAMPASGTLTKDTGVGDASIAFSGVSTGSRYGVGETLRIVGGSQSDATVTVTGVGSVGGNGGAVTAVSLAGGGALGGYPLAVNQGIPSTTAAPGIPLYGILVDGAVSSDNTFINSEITVVACSGIKLASAINTLILNGTFEDCNVGIEVDSTSDTTTIVGADLEANIIDILLAGSKNTLLAVSCVSPGGVKVSGSRNNSAHGGYVGYLNADSASHDNHFYGVCMQSEPYDGGTNNTWTGIYNEAAASPVADRHTTYATPPLTGFHNRGEVIYNSAPASAGYIGWVCTVASDPGPPYVAPTWKTFGLIS